MDPFGSADADPMGDNEYDPFGEEEVQPDAVAVDVVDNADTTDEEFDAGNLTEEANFGSPVPEDDEGDFAGEYDPFQGDDSPLSRWEAERNAVLEARRGEEAANKAAKVEEAAQAITKFFEKRTEDISAAEARNLKAEEDAKAGLSNIMANGTIWEQVGSLVDLKPKDNKKGKANVSRMREILVQMKNEK